MRSKKSLIVGLLFLVSSTTLYGPYLRETGRYRKASQHLQGGTIEEVYEELSEHLKKEKRYLKAEKYNPDIAINWIYFPNVEMSMNGNT